MGTILLLQPCLILEIQWLLNHKLANSWGSDGMKNIKVKGVFVLDTFIDFVTWLTFNFFQKN